LVIISCGLLVVISSLPASVIEIVGFRFTNPKALGALMILSLAANAGSVGLVSPS
jgi:hypothetical protein